MEVWQRKADEKAEKNRRCRLKRQRDDRGARPKVGWGVAVASRKAINVAQLLAAEAVHALAVRGNGSGEAKAGREHILAEMAKALDHTREEMSSHAPRIETMQVPKDKIRDIIGTGGKVIREIVEKTGAKINIEDDGTVKIASSNGDSIKAAINWIKSITQEAELGAIYEGTVVKTMDFGAFVNFFGSKDGLVHISQLSTERVNKTTDVVKEGDKVKVKLLGFDDRGKVRLSMRVVDQTTGEDLEAKQKAAESAGE